MALPDQAEQARGLRSPSSPWPTGSGWVWRGWPSRRRPCWTTPAARRPQWRRRVVAAGVFRREGGYWTLSWGAETVRLKDSKGLGYLARLVANPGVEFHALDLLGEGDAAVRADSGDVGPLLDPQAKAAYKRRIADLREDLAEAEANADAGRAARAREELAFLTDELARAVGLGGRDRTGASASERARVNVSRTMKAALAAIAEHAPTLGQHFAQAVRAGIYCSYNPDPMTPVRWNR